MLLDPESLEPRPGDRADPRQRPRRARRPGQAGAAPVGPRDRHDAPAPTSARPPRSSHDLRLLVRGIAAANGMLLGAAGTHPFALLHRPADRRARALPRAGRRARLHRDPRADLRHPRPRRDRRPGQGDLRRRRDPPLPAAAARPLGELPVLRGRADERDVGANADLPRLPARGRAAALRDVGDLLASGRADDARGRDRGLHVPLVGRPPAPEPRHGRDAHLRSGDPAGGHRRVRGADPVALPPIRGALRGRRAPHRAAPGADRRQQGPRRRQRNGRDARRLRPRGARAGHRPRPAPAGRARRRRRRARLLGRAAPGRGDHRGRARAPRVSSPTSPSTARTWSSWSAPRWR